MSETPANVLSVAQTFYEADPQEGYDSALKRATIYCAREERAARQFMRKAASAKLVNFTRNARGSHGCNAHAARFGR